MSFDDEILRPSSSLVASQLTGELSGARLQGDLSVSPGGVMRSCSWVRCVAQRAPIRYRNAPHVRIAVEPVTTTQQAVAVELVDLEESGSGERRIVLVSVKLARGHGNHRHLLNRGSDCERHVGMMPSATRSFEETCVAIMLAIVHHRSDLGSQVNSSTLVNGSSRTRGARRASA